MSNLVFGVYFFIRVVLLMTTMLVFGFVFWKEDWIFTQFVLGCLIVILSVEFMVYARRAERNVQRLLDMLKFDDYSRTIDQKGSNSPLMKTMQAVKERHEERLELMHRKEAIIRDTLESIELGVCIVMDEQEVLAVNSGFRELLNISEVSSLKQVFAQVPGLEKTISSVRGSERLLLNPEEYDYAFSDTLELWVHRKTFKGSKYMTLVLEKSSGQESSIDFDAWLSFGKVISHEINNGITPVLSLSESIIHLLSADRDSIQVEKIEEASSIIMEQCQSLLKFNEKYHQLIKIPPLNMEALDLQSILEKTFATYQKNLEGVKYAINFPEGVALIEGDTLQLERVFSNLLINSLHAIENVENKTIFVSVEEKKEKYVIRFSDNGSGIADDVRPLIFVPYFSTREGGSGIGLSLVRQILWKHGATIQLKPTDHGTSFVILFPKRGLR